MNFPPCHYLDNILHIENVPLDRIAKFYGTPLYLYSAEALRNAYHAYEKALIKQKSLICYAVKANSNIAILNLFAKLGAGFDIVSIGELKRVIAAGGSPSKTVFSGVGKTKEEIRFALEHNIHCFNIESEAELLRIQSIAKELGKVAPISLRINPDVDAKTHPYISTGLKTNKFGLAYDSVLKTYQNAKLLDHIAIKGIDCHIGSQITEISPYLDALDKVLDMVELLEKQSIPIEHIDLGGGLGIQYQDEQPPTHADLYEKIIARLHSRNHHRKTILIEPGRSLVGNAGVLLTEVQYTKTGEAKNFIIVDAAMNDLARPAMYEAYHEMITVKESSNKGLTADVVGPICETGDWLGKDRQLDVSESDLIAILSSGAYGMTMSSNYNTRGRAAEVMINGDEHYLIRQRESVEYLLSLENIAPI